MYAINLFISKLRKGVWVNCLVRTYDKMYQVLISTSNRRESNTFNHYNNKYNYILL